MFINGTYYEAVQCNTIISNCHAAQIEHKNRQIHLQLGIISIINFNNKAIYVFRKCIAYKRYGFMHTLITPIDDGFAAAINN